MGHIAVQPSQSIVTHSTGRFSCSLIGIGEDTVEIVCSVAGETIKWIGPEIIIGPSVGSLAALAILTTLVGFIGIAIGVIPTLAAVINDRLAA